MNCLEQYYNDPIAREFTIHFDGASLFAYVPHCAKEENHVISKRKSFAVGFDTNCALECYEAMAKAILKCLDNEENYFRKLPKEHQDSVLTAVYDSENKAIISLQNKQCFIGGDLVPYFNNKRIANLESICWTEKTGATKKENKILGSFVMQQFGCDPLVEVFGEYEKLSNLPKFDITLTGENTVGAKSSLTLFGVKIIESTSGFSYSDLQNSVGYTITIDKIDRWHPID